MLQNLQRCTLAAMVFSVLSLVGASVHSGTLQVRDRAEVLSPADESSLRSAVLSYPFDVRVVTDTGMSDRVSFERYVAAQLTSPNMVVLGIDPTHRWTAVHFGTSTRITSQHYSAIANAGDPFFRGARWGDGINAILGAAQRSMGSETSVTNGALRSARSFPWSLALFGLAAIVGIGLLMRALRRRAMDPAGQGPSPYRSPEVQNNPYHGGGGYNPGYPGGYAPGPGGGLGTGLAGAAVGGLAGYALANAMHNREGNEHGGSTNDQGPSPDAGGSSSGWDGGGGDGGGGDGGDGGGGGDW